MKRKRWAFKFSLPGRPFFSYKRLFWIQFSLIILVLLSFAFTFLFSAPNSFSLFVSEKPPLYKEVKALMDPLEYSALETFVSERGSLVFDFKNKQWIIKNIRQFNENGDLVLMDDRYGTCAELSIYMYDKLRSIFDSRFYDLEIVETSESSYFPYPHGVHYVLILTDYSNIFPQEYIIDPSFNRYAHISDFDDYIINRELFLNPTLSGDTDQNEDISRFTPLIIRKNHLISLLVGSINEKFDPNNFIIQVLIKRKYFYNPKQLITFQKLNGNFSIIENRELSMIYLKDKEYMALKEKILSSLREQELID